MKFSIITPTFNSAETLSDTIESVLRQDYSNVEYVMVDGASTDTTKEIIESYKNKLSIVLISEPDKGIYDAMNKGILKSTGDIVGILNSDDFFHTENILSKVHEAFQNNPEIDAVYGDLVYVDRENISKQTRYWKSGEYTEKKLDTGWVIPHPSLFIKREVYQKYNALFDTRFQIAADYELILRLLKIHKIKTKYLPEILVTMRDGGTSAHSIKQRIKGWQELQKAWKINSLPTPKFFIYRRVLSKLSQFFKKSS